MAHRQMASQVISSALDTLRRVFARCEHGRTTGRTEVEQTWASMISYAIPLELVRCSQFHGIPLTNPETEIRFVVISFIAMKLK